MSKIRIDVSYADHDDFLALHMKKATDDAQRCDADECIDLAEWKSVDLVGGRGELELDPGKYYYRYEAGNTTGNKIDLKIHQDGELILNPIITIGSGDFTTGCNIFRIWS